MALFDTFLYNFDTRSEFYEIETPLIEKKPLKCPGKSNPFSAYYPTIGQRLVSVSKRASYSYAKCQESCGLSGRKLSTFRANHSATCLQREGGRGGGYVACALSDYSAENDTHLGSSGCGRVAEWCMGGGRDLVPLSMCRTPIGQASWVAGGRGGRRKRGHRPITLSQNNLNKSRTVPPS